jgi:hypothetical protein
MTILTRQQGWKKTHHLHPLGIYALCLASTDERFDLLVGLAEVPRHF